MEELTETSVRFRNGDLSLAGVLMAPPDPHGRPGAVFVHGSGFSDSTNRWYRAFAEHLVRRGLVVLLPDKRGSGASDGDWRTADFQDLAGDVLAAMECLRGQEGVDARRVGLVAVSQGGWVTSLVATRSSDVAYVVVLSGSAVTPRESFAHEVQEDVRSHRLPKWVSRLVLPVSHLLLQRRWKRWPEVAAFDPTPLWEEVRAPVLFINGGEDANVPVAESVRRLEEVARRKGGSSLAVRVFPGSGHGLFDPGTKSIRSDVFEVLDRWLLEHGLS